MAGRDLKALIAAYRDRDDLSFRRAANAIIEEEEAKRHTTLARDLRRILAAGADVGVPIDPTESQAPRDRETDLPLVDLVRPRRNLSTMVVNDELREALDELVLEVGMWHELDRAGIPRRRAVLLHGPPGCGKTSIAEAVATELQRTLVVVRTESVVSSFLGETASNLSKIFDFAASAPLVVLFDEFDSLGKTRTDSSDHGELRRVVNAVLHLIDRYSGPSLIFAATNHSEILDSALWRRFSEVFEVPLPTMHQRLSVLRRVLQGREEPDLDLGQVAESLTGLPHAAVERTAHDAARLALLAHRRTIRQTDVNDALGRTLRRRWS